MPNINITISQQDGTSSAANGYTEDPADVQKALEVLSLLTDKAARLPEPTPKA